MERSRIPEGNVLDTFRSQITTATAQRTPLRIRGGGTKDWYGQAVTGDVLDTRAYTGIIEYDPAELVITARCGTPLAEIEQVLASHQQMLPFEPPHFAHLAGSQRATIGGVVAAGLAGPRRPFAGAVRDFVLGASIFDGHGQRLNFGGRVMKNVAGYDVARLMAGSLGTLGLILEVSIKVLPVSVAETTLKFDCSASDAVRKINEWAGRPLPISATAWRNGVMAIRLSGAEAAIKSARSTLGGEAVDAVEATRFWDGLREQTDPYFADIPDGCGLWRIAVPPIAEPAMLQGQRLMEWGCAQRWWVTDADPHQLRASARQAGGHATLFRGGDKRVGVFTPLAPPLMAIHRRLKQTFDPANIFNRGRLYPDF
ncbi:glycolate dehydrogenase, putative FAD-binding subunit [Pararobbsia alpina]|uniref:glycolate oxidase subunit GlcE n=1 Tax=Pararobbsia alpina TaxID=621374 RepID=UPI0039A42A28